MVTSLHHLQHYCNSSFLHLFLLHRVVITEKRRDAFHWTCIDKQNPTEGDWIRHFFLILLDVWVVLDYLHLMRNWTWFTSTVGSSFSGTSEMTTLWLGTWLRGVADKRSRHEAAPDKLLKWEGFFLQKIIINNVKMKN